MAQTMTSHTGSGPSARPLGCSRSEASSPRRARDVASAQSFPWQRDRRLPCADGGSRASLPAATLRQIVGKLSSVFEHSRGAHRGRSPTPGRGPRSSGP
ncbi:hypothetical protein ANANG_G00085930 [Anguilla anguilla]|uniref:Uncharacterized protein n=1 Tax=Anguilla anguilla TaxID=7936 RepID=A0A9D3MNZ4_ANGAN|nr:hypothetical protein ANANG_G00085930 [Anguilla anguilla]